MIMQKKMPTLTFIRFILSGALAGAAIFGVLAPLFGIDPTHTKDAIGGTIGATIVAIGFKLADFA